MPIVELLTDFAIEDAYVGTMKGALIILATPTSKKGLSSWSVKNELEDYRTATSTLSPKILSPLWAVSDILKLL
jgi:hypothetical protein